MAARERLSLLRRGAMTQLRSLLQVVFPEFEAIFPLVTKKTPVALLRAFPTPEDLLQASKARVLRVLHSASRGHLGAETYEWLVSPRTAPASVRCPRGTRSDGRSGRC